MKTKFNLTQQLQSNQQHIKSRKAYEPEALNLGFHEQKAR